MYGGRRRHPDFDAQDTTENDQWGSYYRSNKENRHSDRYSDAMAKTRSGDNKPAPRKKGAAKKRREEEADQDVNNPQEEAVREPKQIPNGMTMVQYVTFLEAKANIASRHAPAKSRNSSDLTSEQKRWINDVKSAVKEYAWGSVKFINDDRKLARVTGKIFDLMKPTGYDHLTGKALDEARAEWVVTNQDHVRTGLTDIRNYAQGQVRDLIVQHLKDGKQVPTPEQIKMCALRDPKMAEEKNQWIFEMYWDELLFKVVGKEYWDSNIRHYQLISSAKRGPEEDAKPCISSGTEAFLVTIYQNAYARWVYIGECKRDKKELDRKHARYQVDFIDCNKGQARWGGWNDEGRKYFQDMRKQIDEALSHENARKLEEECLARLRVKHKIVIDGKEAKKKKRKAAVLDEEVIDDGDEL